MPVKAKDQKSTAQLAKPFFQLDDSTLKFYFRFNKLLFKSFVCLSLVEPWRYDSSKSHNDVTKVKLKVRVRPIRVIMRNSVHGSDIPGFQGMWYVGACVTVLIMARVKSEAKRKVSMIDDQLDLHFHGRQAVTITRLSSDRIFLRVLSFPEFLYYYLFRFDRTASACVTSSTKQIDSVLYIEPGYQSPAYEVGFT